MRYPILIALLSVSLGAQDPPNCNDNIALMVDVRCSCIKDPSSQQCEWVKKGFYDSHDFTKIKPLDLGAGITYNPPKARTILPRSQPVQTRQARVVTLPHKDYLRFLHPNARLVAGFDFRKIFQSPELVASLFGADDADARTKVMAALKEMDYLWLSFAPPNDVVILMTGQFEQGVAAGMFYAQGIRPVFLGGPHAMMVGAEPYIQAALARLGRPASPGGWVTRRAQEFSKDHETWIVK